MLYSDERSTMRPFLRHPVDTRYCRKHKNITPYTLMVLSASRESAFAASIGRTTPQDILRFVLCWRLVASDRIISGSSSVILKVGSASIAQDHYSTCFLHIFSNGDWWRRIASWVRLSPPGVRKHGIFSV